MVVPPFILCSNASSHEYVSTVLLGAISKKRYTSLISFQKDVHPETHDKIVQGPYCSPRKKPKLFWQRL